MMKPCSSSQPPADQAYGLEWVGGDRDLLMELTAIFLADHPDRIAALSQAIAAGDAAGIQHVAHTIKGSVAGFGAHRARSLAVQLEGLGRAKQVSDAPAVFSELAGELERLVQHLQSAAWTS
jgi:HPt (histidine-containing phosphotransfer) domain-containing protein